MSACRFVSVLSLTLLACSSSSAPAPGADAAIDTYAAPDSALDESFVDTASDDSACLPHGADCSEAGFTACCSHMCTWTDGVGSACN